MNFLPSPQSFFLNVLVPVKFFGALLYSISDDFPQRGKAWKAWGPLYVYK